MPFDAIAVIDKLDESKTTEALKLMKTKILYSVSAFEECDASAREVIEINSENYDAHYLLGASLVSRELFQEVMY
jgi:hypothetical protein